MRPADAVADAELAARALRASSSSLICPGLERSFQTSILSSSFQECFR
jgi:hypothetical protein